MNNYKKSSFKVTLNWVGIFELITLVCAMVSIIWFDVFILSFKDNHEDVTTGEYVGLLIFFLLGTVLVIIVSVLNLFHYVSDRVIVNGNEVIIKSAFRKKQQINVSEITSYSNTAKKEKIHRYYEISIYLGEKEAVSIRNDRYKNYDLLLYYLSKNCTGSKV